MIEPVSAKASFRVLQFLEGVAAVDILEFNDGKKRRLLLQASAGKKIICTHEQLDALHKASLINRKENKCELSSLGKKRIRRANAIAEGAEDGGFQAQHQTIEQQQRRVNGISQSVAVNTNESPLHRLNTRKTADGSTWLDSAAYEAGERLRQDFTQGQLMQKVTASWEPTHGIVSKGGGAGGKVELSDYAIDARSRMETALDSVGPELAGVLTDVCCFLKGLESVERERRWPPRSAKVMLRAGLNLLARHYGAASKRRSKRQIKKWHTADYRPSLV